MGARGWSDWGQSASVNIALSCAPSQIFQKNSRLFQTCLRRVEQQSQVVIVGLWRSQVSRGVPLSQGFSAGTRIVCPTPCRPSLRTKPWLLFRQTGSCLLLLFVTSEDERLVFHLELTPIVLFAIALWQCSARFRPALTPRI
jgi:hypothetical protein